MIWLVMATVAAGFAFGRVFLDAGAAPALDRWVDGALLAMMVVVGIDIGRQPEAWAPLLRRGLRLVAVPLLVAVGSIAGAAAAAPLLGLPPLLAAAAAAGFGWYSLSGAMLTSLVDPAAGTLAFLGNVFRELLTFLLAVPLVRRLGPLAPVAVGGATAMDTTMPVIARASGPGAALTGFASGLLLAAAAPFLIEALARLHLGLGS
ncbi:MAG: lysine exporter LysO family protein [Thermaerobacter sp.]|nr:hypothetical protein [Bacillota bacterium]REJ37885.1 MAG: hypothetical protein DIU84_02850 [Bacillota bacterium]